MNPLASLDAMGVVFGLFVAALAARLSRAPGWGHLRGLAATGVASAVFFAASFTFFALPSHAPAVARAVLGSTLPILWTWARYGSAYLGEPLPRWWKPLLGAAAAVAVVGLLPGVTFTDRVTMSEGALGLRLVVVEGTPLGGVVMLAMLATLGGFGWRFVRAWRRGVSGAGEHALGAALALVAATWDVVAVLGAFHVPFLADVGLLVALALITLGFTSRFRREAEERRLLGEELGSEVARRTAELEARGRDAARAAELASLGRLAAGVAHEVNSPLAAARATLDWLEDVTAVGSDEEAIEALEDARRSLERIRGIVRQLGFASGAAPGVTAAPVDLDRAVGDALRAARTRRAGAAYTAEVPPGVAVLADEGALVQVLVNLLLNAGDAVAGREGGGRVSLRAAARGDGVRLEVEDDGPGMPPDVQARLFEPFFSTKAFGRGTGLGLAVSRGLVAALGGRLEIESAPGRGTLARFDLPRAAAARAPVEAPPPVEGPRRLRLLLVDDDRAVRNALRRLLAARHDVALADGVESARSLLGGESFDAVLCDLVMPDGGGERLYRLVLAERPAVAGRFVFITGGARDEEGRRFLASQPQPVLEKPLDAAALEAVLSALVGAEARAG